VNTRITSLMAAVSALVLAATAGGQGDGKPVKKIVRAADGLALVCEVRGTGDTALVFLHGLSGDREYWKNQADAFAADYRVVTYDQAGHGESGKGRAIWTTAALAADAEAVAKDLGLKRVILVGHSMGGPVALQAAKRLPGTVVGVVGVDTLQNAEHQMPEAARAQLLDAFEKDYKATMRAGLNGLVAEKSDAGVKAFLAAKSDAQDPKVAVALLRDLFALDQKKLLKEAGVPVRCVNSGGGMQFFTPTAAAVNKKYADYDAVLIADVGHYPMLEKPAEFNAKLRAVLKEFAAKK
jgi:pimeloyl-ACP methyl ester carboxylesterase